MTDRFQLGYTTEQDALDFVQWAVGAGLAPREVWLALGMTEDLHDITWGDVVDAASAAAWAMRAEHTERQRVAA